MNLARHYRTLGLRRGASSREVKDAYRMLVRRYHPDINPDQAAVEQFIKINDAYTALSESMQARERTLQGRAVQVVSTATAQHETAQHETAQHETVAGQEGLDTRLQGIRLTLEKWGFTTFSEDNSPSASASAASARHRQSSVKDVNLKQAAYQQLKGLLKLQKFPRAIALVEGLAHRMPEDAEIIQWQAIVYQRWGRQLILEGQTHKARIYLKKALRTDPNNRSLWREVNRDFWQLASLGS